MTFKESESGSGIVLCILQDDVHIQLFNIQHCNTRRLEWPESGIDRPELVLLLDISLNLLNCPYQYFIHF